MLYQQMISSKGPYTHWPVFWYH